MDKVVDHLLVFHGDGDVQDFPGNYTQYRDWKAMQSKALNEVVESKKQAKPRQNNGASSERRRLSFKEKREFEMLEKEISDLELEKKEIEEQLCSGNLGVEELTNMSKRLPLLQDELDEKSMRWLELSELE